MKCAAGVLNQQPIETKGGFEYTIETRGRFLEPEQFENIIVKHGENGRVTRLREVARVELAAKNYATNGYLDDDSALPIVIFQRPGSNALETAQALRDEMQDVAKSMPAGIEPTTISDPTQFLTVTINEIYKDWKSGAEGKGFGIGGDIEENRERKRE